MTLTLGGYAKGAGWRVRRSWRFAMVRSADASIVRADMSAFEFHEAAWDASDREAPPPDPSTLSDRALYVVMRYEERDLPSDTVEVLEAECRRRGLLVDVVERLIGLGLMAVVAISGLVIGWMLFAR
jgi:hypothetical protein